MRLQAFDVLVRAVQRGYTLDEVRPCLTQHLGGGWFDVDVDHPAYPRVVRDDVVQPPSILGAASEMLEALGVDISTPDPCLCGTQLKTVLKDWLGIEATPTCSCNAMARKMDERGPEWCASDEGMAEILGVMRTEHAKRWADGRTILPWTDAGARQLVLLACRRAKAV
jgi:hypothetical protein